jgi:hypothetical protein
MLLSSQPVLSRFDRGRRLRLRWRKDECAWAEMASAFVSAVSSTVATGGGASAAISAVIASGISLPPEGMSETRPSASAPAAIAVIASLGEAMQQILTLVLIGQAAWFFDKAFAAIQGGWF